MSPDCRLPARIRVGGWFSLLYMINFDTLGTFAQIYIFICICIDYFVGSTIFKLLLNVCRFYFILIFAEVDAV